MIQLLLYAFFVTYSNVACGGILGIAANSKFIHLTVLLKQTHLEGHANGEKFLFCAPM